MPLPGSAQAAACTLPVCAFSGWRACNSTSAWCSSVSEIDRTALNRSGMANRLFDGFGAAQAAAGSPGEITLPIQQRRETLTGDADAHFEAAGIANDFHRFDLIRPLRPPLR